jgi:hypothetical protein
MSAHDTHDHAHDNAHGHGHSSGEAHGTRRDYVIGFVLSVILTAIPFGLVMSGVIVIDGVLLPVVEPVVVTVTEGEAVELGEAERPGEPLGEGVASAPSRTAPVPHPTLHEKLAESDAFAPK